MISIPFHAVIVFFKYNAYCIKKMRVIDLYTITKQCLNKQAFLKVLSTILKAGRKVPWKESRFVAQIISVPFHASIVY